MTIEFNRDPGFAFACDVERAYTSLIASRGIDTHASLDEEPGLGGWLFYVGELNPPARALLVAGNIAGAASLTATADASVQKQAIRDGVVDFLVTSLDEALRILKNEIRKREPVAVCIAAEPRDVETEMLERGVLPDLLPPASMLPQCRQQPVFAAPSTESILLSWTVASAPARWLPKLDILAQDCLGPEASATLVARRWLRLSPRYLGRLANNHRVLRCSSAAAESFRARVESAVASGEIAVSVRIAVDSKDLAQLDSSF